MEGGEGMEVIIKGDAKEIAALLFEVEGRRSVPFVGECQESALGDEKDELVLCRPDGI